VSSFPAGSLSVRLSDGPGQCVGRLEVQFRGQWSLVEKNSRSNDDNTDAACKQLGCGRARRDDQALGQFTQGSLTPFLQMTCRESQNLSDCEMIQEKRRTINQATTIVCEGLPVLRCTVLCTHASFTPLTFNVAILYFTI